jgi:hypothetical protein
VQLPLGDADAQVGAAYFFAEGNSRIWRVSEESGIGREGSTYGIDDWLELKYLAMGL